MSIIPILDFEHFSTLREIPSPLPLSYQLPETLPLPQATMDLLPALKVYHLTKPIMLAESASTRPGPTGFLYSAVYSVCPYGGVYPHLVFSHGQVCAHHLAFCLLYQLYTEASLYVFILNIQLMVQAGTHHGQLARCPCCIVLHPVETLRTGVLISQGTAVMALSRSKLLAPELTDFMT